MIPQGSQFFLVAFGHVVGLTFKMVGHALILCVLFWGRETGEFGAGVTLGAIFEAIGTLDPLCPHHGPSRRSSTTRRLHDFAKLHLFYAMDTTEASNFVFCGIQFVRTTTQEFPI